MKKIVLKHVLNEAPKTSDFASIDVSEPICPEDGIVIQIKYISIDPYVGTSIHRGHMGEPIPEPGSGVIPGGGVGEVIESKSHLAAVGDFVFGANVGWVERVALKVGEFRKVDPERAPLSTWIGVLGMPGLTAWAGVSKILKVTEGDVFLVNAAAGPVGGTAGQIARMRGAKTVIGIAGGAVKCDTVVREYGFDACIDYKAENWEDELEQIAPNGISTHFENVSERMLELAMDRMQPYGRAVICGLAGHYHKDGPPANISLGMIVRKRAAIYGLVVYDFYDQWDNFIDEVSPFVKSQKIVVEEDRVEGLENAPALLSKLVKGENVGKCVVEL